MRRFLAGGRLVPVVAWAVGSLAAGCDADGGGAGDVASDVVVAEVAPNERAACSGGGRGSASGCAEGQVVDADGRPVAGVRVAGCSSGACITGTSGDDGRFAIQGLPVEPHKFEVLAVPKGFFATIFFADVTAGRMVGPTRPVVLPRLPDGRSEPFDPAAGGTLSLAEGALVLEAAPGALAFPIGAASEGATAAFVPVEDLPDYDVSPWVGHEVGAFALVVHPFPLKIEGEVKVTLIPPSGAGAGPWDLHVVHGSSGRLERVGALEDDGAGGLRLADPAALGFATVLVAVPR